MILHKSITNCYGIYIIRNKITKKVYIGSSDKVRKRLSGHLSCLRRNVHHSKHLQNAFNKYGEENFTFKLLEETKALFKKEEYWCKVYKANDRKYGYNVRIVTNSNRGNKVTFSIETRQLISSILKGRIPSNLEEMRKGRWKPVKLYIDGKYFETYDNQREASRYTGVTFNAINSQAIGRTKVIRSHPNYLFVYKN